ncbi:copper resistance CopC family protein [Metabacillus sp. RGM 3146]|uniref:copper resistance CopC family protein n=1 Tax=Metabacillus sp. RGM 3146 TaxID=3401092 RepID=UPI003B99ADA6
MKKIILVLLIIFSFSGAAVSAHSRLVSSTPKDGAVIKEPLNTISLTFNTMIEPTSTFKLLLGSKEIPVSNVQIDGKTVKGEIPKNLENGDYTVKWNIVGVDGHQIQGKLGFTADLKKQETAPAAQKKKEEPAKKETKQQTEPTNKEKMENKQASNKSGINPAIMVLAGILVIAAIAGLFTVMRKGKK